MSTLLHLDSVGELIKYDPALPPTQQEMRLVYLRPQARDWLRDTLPGIDDGLSELDALEEVYDFLALFCSGGVLTFERQLHPMFHLSSGVWELKTRLIRLFGWFPVRDCFVCTNGASASQVKRYGLYPDYRDQAITFRDGLDLDEPKFIPSGDPNDVVSAFSYP